MQIFGFANCLVSEVIRPSAFALLLSTSAAVVSVGNASQQQSIDLRSLGVSGTLVTISK